MISNQLCIGDRQIRRYCSALKAAGFPLKSKSGKYGGYYLEEPQIYPSEWEILRESLPRELYRKLELRLLEEFKPQE